MPIFMLKIISLILYLARIAAFLIILLLLVPYLALWKPTVATNPYYAKIVQFEHKISSPFNDFIHKVIKNPPDPMVLDFVKIILFLIISSNLKYAYLRTRHYTNYRQQKKMLERWKLEKNIAQNSSLFVELEDKLAQMSQTTDKEVSKKLYEEFTELKRKLEKMSRYFAFLSVDVVDSTGMKNSEDKSLIQIDSLRFKKMMQKLFDENGCVKSAWTPDGAMVCFNTVDSAVNAAQASLKRLKQFNEHEKSISRDFLIRCGIHAGIIYYDESLPLEEITDQVIDIAGHMQKHAAPGTIAVSKPSIKPLENTIGFSKIEKVVDNLEVYQWQIGQNGINLAEKPAGG